MTDRPTDRPTASPKPEPRPLLVVTCRLCGGRLARNRGSKLWHCTNPDMGHRKLVPDVMVPRFEAMGSGDRFPSVKAAKEKGVPRSKLERLEKVTV